MLKTIKRFFNNLAPESEQSEDDKKHAIQLAVSVLLVEMSRMDGKVTANEIDKLKYQLTSQFQLSTEEKQELLDLAGEKLNESTDYYQFTSIINQQFDQPKKIAMIENLWEIAYSDGELNAHEEHYLRKINALLHISHKDFIKTKHRAQTKN